MIYAVIEDKKDRFGGKVWELLRDGLDLNDSLVIKSSRGNTLLLDKIVEVVEVMKRNDVLLVSIDNFSYKAADTKVEITLYLKSLGIKHYISRYGSMEALLLSFPRFFSWVHFCQGDYPVSVSVYLNALKIFWVRCRKEQLFTTARIEETALREEFRQPYFSEELGRNTGMFFSVYPHYMDELAKPYYDALNGPDRDGQVKTPPKNWEQAASRLLESLTCESGFKSNKGVLGPCWCKDCCHDTNENSKGKFPGTSLKACNSNWISDEELMAAIGDITVIPGNTPFKKLQWVRARNEELRKGLHPGGWTRRDKARMLLFESDFARGFSDSNGNIYSLAEILGINSPDANQLPPPEPLPETEPQWNQQQATSPAWNAYQQPTPPQEPQPPQSSTRGGMRSQVRMQQYYTDVGNPYQQPAEAREQAPQSHNQLPAPAGNPDNIECTATSAFGAIEGYLFCTPRGTYGIWKEIKNKKVISIVGLTDEQLITIGPAEKKSIKELRAEFNSWKQKQIGSYGNGWELNDSVSIAFGDKPRQNPPNQ